MRSETCPVNGEFIMSIETQIEVPQGVPVLDQDVLAQRQLGVQSDASSVFAVQNLIHLLKDAERRLQALNLHPLDSTVIGVRTQDIEDLTVYIARKATKQRRLDDDLAAEVSIELESAKAMVSRLSPLVNKWIKRELRVEQLCQSLSKEPDPVRARAAFVALSNGNDPICSGAEIIHQGTNDQPRSAIQLQGDDVHRVIVRVTSVDKLRRACRVRLGSLPEPSSIFTSKDLDVRVIDVSIDDDDLSWLLVSLAAAVNQTLDMKLAINAKLDAKGGIAFSGRLIGVPDAKKACQRLEAALAASMASLF